MLNVDFVQFQQNGIISDIRPGSGNAMSKINKHDHAECMYVIGNKDQTRIDNQTVHII